MLLRVCDASFVADGSMFVYIAGSNDVTIALRRQHLTVDRGQKTRENQRCSAGRTFAGTAF